MQQQPAYTLQTDTPIYPNVLYNRPVTRHGAGRLLIAGGHSGDFSLPTSMYELAEATGLGECSVLLPDTLAKLLGGSPGIWFAPTNPSGSLALEALGKLLELAESADAVALGASLSNNSTTAILIERAASTVTQPIIYFADALSLLRHNVTLITDNPNALVIATMPEVFKLCGALGIPIQIRPDAGLLNKLEIIDHLRDACAAQLVVYGTETVVSAEKEQVVTPTNYRLAAVPAIFYAVLATFWIQNMGDPKAGLATGAYVLRQVAATLDSGDRPTISRLSQNLASVLKAADF